MDSERLRGKLNGGFSSELDPCEREALSIILENELDRSLNQLEKKLQNYWECRD